MNEHVWWYAARASGLVAWALAGLSVLWGLALATRALGRRPGSPWMADLHRFLGGLAVLFTGVHLVALWADPYVGFRVVDLLVPFSAGWKPVAVALGIVAFWLLVAVELTSLWMRRLSKRWWRWVHLSSYLLFAAATLHLFLAGSDASSVVARAAAALVGGWAAFFLVYRWIGPGKRASVARRDRRGTMAA